MNITLDMKPSIFHQVERIEHLYLTFVEALRDAKEHREKLLRARMEIYHREWGGDGPYLCMSFLLPIYFALLKEFRLAWIMAEYDRSWDRPTILSVKHTWETPVSWDVNLFWEDWKSKEYTKYRKPYPIFCLNDDEYNRKVIDSIRYPSDDKLKRDLSPEGRYIEFNGTAEANIRLDEFYENVRILALSLTMEQYAEAEEALFRLKHAISTGRAPSHLMEFPAPKLFIPPVYFYEAYLRARLEPRKEVQRSLGWQAVYWLMESLLRSYKTRYLFMERPFHDFCGIIGDFDLFGEDQEEFLRYFKMFAMQSCPSAARKMMGDPTPILRYDEIDAFTSEECKNMYDKMYPPKKK